MRLSGKVVASSRLKQGRSSVTAPGRALHLNHKNPMNVSSTPITDPKTYSHAAALSGDDLLGYPEVRQLTTIGEERLREMFKQGEFPQPTRLGKRRLVWPRTTVLAWLAAKFDASNAGKAVDTQGGGK